jgi:hypothetical protein
VARVGLAGGNSGSLGNGGGTAGAVNGGVGGNGTDGLANAVYGGGGGGGGGSINNAGTGGAGGIGGAPGGGGGGGGVGGNSAGATPGTGGTGGGGARGEVKITTLRGTGADLAEIYSTNDIDMEAGDVVAIDKTLVAGVKKTERAYDSNVIGVISTDPGVVIGNINEDPGKTPVIVALSGRVPMKVTLENGPIKKGDLLTPSSTPGKAMKAIKAGVIIGQSMTDYDGSMPLGYVVAFIKNTYAHGEKISEVLSGEAAPTTDADGNIIVPAAVAPMTIQQQALSYFKAHKGALAEAVEISEINTDRLTAGLEIITPKVITSDLATDTISASTGKDIGMNLDADGKFVINSVTAGVAGATSGDTTDPVTGETIPGTTTTTTTSTPVITFDSLGNALFAGTVTAKNISAESISGINVITDQLSTLEDTVNSISSQHIDLSSLVTLATTVGELGTKVDALDTDLTARLTAVEGSLASVSLTDAVLTTLSVSGSATFSGGLMTDSIGTLGSTLTLSSNVDFIGRPYFTTDTGGFAVVKTGATEVAVEFSSDYLDQPIVNATISLDDADSANATAIFTDDVRYLVTKKSMHGFTILLNKPATSDIRFSWMALAVHNPTTVFSLITEPQNPEGNQNDGNGNIPPPPNPGDTPPNGGGDTTGGGGTTPPSGPDTVPPVISLVGNSAVTITAGDTFADPGATALDDVDGDVTVSIIVSGIVNTEVPGTYTLAYIAADSAGNTAGAERTVTVVPTPAPTE